MNQFKSTTLLVPLAIAGAVLIAGGAIGNSASALAADRTYTLRIQTHFSPETESGKLAAQFAEDVQVMSNGTLVLDMYYSSAMVKSVETFDAAASGILDGDMTSAAYQSAKDPAFQFVSDVVGAYDTPYQQHAWFFNGGEEVAQKLYNRHGMELIGWWIPGQESLSSALPMADAEDLKNRTFRSPPGLQTMVLESLGAKPAAMDLTEIFTSLKSKDIDGADASGLANNKGIGLYDIVKHATYPGFHSMPSDHLAINKSKWDALPEHLQRIVKVAMQKLAFQTALTFEVKNREAAVELSAAGITLHNWSEVERSAFRTRAQASWADFVKDSAEATALADSHRKFSKKLGLIE